MRKLISIFLAAVMVFSLAACGSGKEKVPDSIRESGPITLSDRVSLHDYMFSYQFRGDLFEAVKSGIPRRRREYCSGKRYSVAYYELENDVTEISVNLPEMGIDFIVCDDIERAHVSSSYEVFPEYNIALSVGCGSTRLVPLISPAEYSPRDNMWESAGSLVFGSEELRIKPMAGFLGTQEEWNAWMDQMNRAGRIIRQAVVDFIKSYADGRVPFDGLSYLSETDRFISSPEFLRGVNRILGSYLKDGKIQLDNDNGYTGDEFDGYAMGLDIKVEKTVYYDADGSLSSVVNEFSLDNFDASYFSTDPVEVIIMGSDRSAREEPGVDLPGNNVRIPMPRFGDSVTEEEIQERIRTLLITEEVEPAYTGPGRFTPDDVGAAARYFTSEEFIEDCGKAASARSSSDMRIEYEYSLNENESSFSRDSKEIKTFVFDSSTTVWFYGNSGSTYALGLFYTMEDARGDRLLEDLKLVKKSTLEMPDLGDYRFMASKDGKKAVLLYNLTSSPDMASVDFEKFCGEIQNILDNSRKKETVTPLGMGEYGFLLDDDFTAQVRQLLLRNRDNVPGVVLGNDVHLRISMDPGYSGFNVYYWLQDGYSAGNPAYSGMMNYNGFTVRCSKDAPYGFDGYRWEDATNARFCRGGDLLVYCDRTPVPDAESFLGTKYVYSSSYGALDYRNLVSEVRLLIDEYRS